MLEKELIQILLDELGVLSDILEIEKTKKESLLAKDYLSLEGITKNEENLFEKLHRYESRRLEIVKKIYEKEKLTGEMNLSNIMKCLVNKEKVTQLREKIIKVIEEIKYTNWENKIILESSISVSMGLLSNIANIEKDLPEYTPLGKKPDTRNISLYEGIV